MSLPRSGRLIAFAVVGVVGTASHLFAEPVDVTFRPPDIESSEVCVPRSPIHKLVARWKDWDGASLPNQPIALMRRDLRLLRQADAKRWADTIRNANDLLLREVDSYDASDRMIDRIDLLIGLGDIDTLKKEGLPEKLLKIASSGSTSAQMMAANLLSNGIGIEPDPKRAMELIRSAAYGGHPDALLQLAALTSEGTKVPDWDIAPNVAVTLAFGALLGDEDARVCDRINQIASHYEKGKVVKQDVDLAEDWYRLSAKLSGTNGAWNVALLHLDADRIERDTSVMLAHLRQASDAGLTYAQLRLGSIYERGALVEKDLGKAEELYREAADAGDPTALTRLVNLERDTSNGSEEAVAEIISLLEEMIKLPDTPAWAFSRLGNLLLEHEGRWAGEERAVAAFQHALEIDPNQVPARSRLARIAMRYVKSDQDFANVTSELRRVVSANGRSDPMLDLQASYQCRGPSAPQPVKSEYWAAIERFSGDKTIHLTGAQLREQSSNADPLVLAQLQTQALNTRAVSLANFLAIRDIDDDTGKLGALRAIVADAGAKTNSAMADVAMTLGRSDEQVEKWLRQAVENNEAGAKMALVRYLREDGVSSPQERDEILFLVRPLAQTGNGAAIRAIVELDDDVDPAAAWRTYADAIERNGDFEALVFALAHLGSDILVDDYVGRIRAVMSCYSANALELVRAMSALGRDEAAQHWIDIARATAETGWEFVAMADTVRELDLSEDPVKLAASLYREGIRIGEPLAIRRILQMGKEGKIELTQDDTVDLYVQMVTTSPPQNIPSVLKMASFAPDSLRERIEARINRRDLYAKAAEQGNPVAQLELAKLIQDDARTPSDLKRYADLIQASAQQGNSDAMLLLSKAYSYGFGIERSAKISDEWLMRAAEAGNREAERTARMLETAKELN